MATVTAALIADPVPGAAASRPENRVKGLDLFVLPRVGVDVPFAPDCIGDFSLHLRQTASAKPYAYVAGNPLNGTDPSGMSPWGGMRSEMSAGASGCSTGNDSSLIYTGPYHPPVADAPSGNPIPSTDPSYWGDQLSSGLGAAKDWAGKELNPGSWSYGVCVVICYQYTPSTDSHQWGIGLNVSAGITGDGAPLPNGGICAGVKVVEACNPNNGPGDLHGNPGNWNATWSAGAGVNAGTYMGSSHKGLLF